MKNSPLKIGFVVDANILQLAAAKYNAQKKFSPSSRRRGVLILSNGNYFLRSQTWLPTHTAFANEESSKLNEQGLAYRKAGNYQAAIEKYSEALKIEPNNSTYYNNIGWAYFHWGKAHYTEAEENFKKSIELNLDYDVAYRGLAHIYRKLEKNDDAIKNFIEAGKKFYKSKDYTAVITDFTDAINLGAKTAEVYDLRGWSYYNSENYDAAFEDFDKIIREIDGNYVDAYKGRADVYLKRDDKVAAQKDFYKAGQIFYDKNNQESWHTAIQYFDSAIELDGSENGSYHFSEADSYRLRGWAYHKLKLDDKALSDLNKAIEIFEKADADKTIAPDEYWAFSDAYNGRGWVYLDKKEYANGIADFKKSIQRYEDYPYPFSGLAKIYKIQSTNDPSKKNLSKENYTTAGELFYKRKEFKIAITEFGEAISLDDKDPKLYYSRGLAYLDSENLDAALEDFTRAIKLDEKYVEVYEARAKVYTKQGNTDAAMKDIETAAQIKPAPEPSNIFEKLSLMLIGEINELFVGLLIVAIIEYLLTISRHGIRERNLTIGVVAGHFAIIIIFFIIVFVVDKLQDNLINNGIIINATIAMFLMWELLLIVDNAERLGVPVPEGLKELLRNIINKIKGFFGGGNR